MSIKDATGKHMMEPELFMARLAEQAERYEDVFEFLTPVLQKRDHFTAEERGIDSFCMLSVAFKNLVIMVVQNIKSGLRIFNLDKF